MNNSIKSQVLQLVNEYAERNAPQPHQIWRTAWAEIHTMFDASINNYAKDPSEYNRGRMEALADASARLHERYVKA